VVAVSLVKAGGTGVWGQVPMPPNPTVPDADMKTMVAYILAMKK
jgi:cytochrome c